MSIRLLEIGLSALLERESGPIGQDLRRRAEIVTAIASQNAAGEVIGIRSGDLQSGIRYELTGGVGGLQAVVRTDAQHRGFNYPAFHDRHGRPWLSGALRDGFDL